MNHYLKRITAAVVAAVICVSAFASCSSKKTITIYSSAEDFRNEMARGMLTEKFPEYNFNLVEVDTGTLAAKMAAEGKDTDCDIILELESTYMKKISDNLAELKDVDFSKYIDDIVPESHKYVPFTRLSGAIILNKKTFEEKNLPIPESYDDLLKPEYKGLISMPNPKSSGTGYIFYLNMVNERGEEAALEYFDKLAENISGQGFTTSGSGPINALIAGEADIAMGMTFQAVKAINDGSDFEIIFFDEGAPYTTYSSAVVSGKETDEDVMKVFKYIISDITPKDKELYMPEPIYKEQEITVANFPKDIKYADMTGIDDITLKESLLDKWKY